MLIRLLCLCSFFIVGIATAQTPMGIPLKSDPPIAIDADLGDWTGLPNTIAIDTPAQVIWGKALWTSAKDMSGVVRLAWRAEHLFIAVDVNDDVVAQTQRGAGIWQGDHIELFLDVVPGENSDQDSLGTGQFHIALSPGNFKHTGDNLVDTSPEAFCYAPEALDMGAVQLMSKQTETGWILEAAIPWATLGVVPEQNMLISVEVGLSDTDSNAPRQESMLTIGTEVWSHSRARLIPMALGDSNGVVKERTVAHPILNAAEIAQGKRIEVNFTAPALPKGKQAVLSILGRLETKKVAGYTRALHLYLNGQGLNGKRLLNKGLRETSRSGASYTMYAAERFTTYYSPDFEAPNDHPHYGLLDGVIPCLFELDVTDLIREGENTLVIQHDVDTRIKNALHVGQAQLVFRTPPPPEAVLAGPPTGTIPVIIPRANHAVKYTAKELPDAKIALSFGGRDIIVESRFSTPAPEWVHGSNDYFKHSRRVEKKPEGLVVYDTFTNLTDKKLGIMHRHEVTMGDDLKTLWVAGLKQPGESGRSSTPANCTTLGLANDYGIGLIARDDVFRVHTMNYGQAGLIGVADNNLVLPPGATYTAEWIVVPVETPDYYRFINSARRFMGANFLIDGGFAFLRQGPLTDKWSDEQLSNFLTYKDAKYYCASIIYPRYKGDRYNHGTAFQQVSHDSYRTSFARWRSMYPNGNYQVYFHCFLDVTEEEFEDFSTARILRPDGTQGTYGKAHQRLYFPTEENTYGKAIAQSIDIILDEIKADGVYWDEHQYSNYTYHFGEPWDGFTGNIHPTTMDVIGLKSSVTLLTEEWRVNIAKDIQSRGSLVGNGAPYTKAMVDLQFPCFIETGSISHLRRGHLYSPIALGDHLTEHSEEDAYGTMLAALDFGSVYHWYGDVTVQPTHKTITSHMFPITPMELHKGYIIGEERIITRLSGLYGWGDDSTHEVHVYNTHGVEVPDFKAPLIKKDGKTFTELRIGENWSAAIVRQ